MEILKVKFNHLSHHSLHSLHSQLSYRIYHYRFRILLRKFNNNQCNKLNLSRKMLQKSNLPQIPVQVATTKQQQLLIFRVRNQRKKLLSRKTMCLDWPSSKPQAFCKVEENNQLTLINLHQLM